MPIEPEPFEPVGAELVDAASAARIRARTSRLDARDRQPVAGAVEQHAAQIEIDRRDNLARPQHHHLVRQRLQPGRAGIFGAGKLAGRQVQQRDPDNGVDPVFIGVRKRQQKRRRALVEMLRIRQRAGGHDADDFALDDALGFFRVFDLIADGDAEAFLDQPREIGIESVMRHAAHRNRRALPSFERDVSVRSSARAATSASS